MDVPRPRRALARLWPPAADLVEALPRIDALNPAPAEAARVTRPTLDRYHTVLNGGRTPTPWPPESFFLALRPPKSPRVWSPDGTLGDGPVGT